MSRRANFNAVRMLLLGAALGAVAPVIAPPAALAAAATSPPAAGSSGGGGLTPTGSTVGSGAGSGTVSVSTQPGNLSLQPSGNGISLATHASTLLRRRLRFSGSVAHGRPGQLVEIERRGRGTNGAWLPTAHGTVGPGGVFTATWPANHIGQFTVRAVVEGRNGAASQCTDRL